MCTRIPYKKLEIKRQVQLNETKQVLIDNGFDLSILDQLISRKQYSVIAYYCGLKCDLIHSCIIQPPLSNRSYKSISDIINNIGLVFMYVNDPIFIYKFTSNHMQQFKLDFDIKIDIKDRPTPEEIKWIKSLIRLMIYIRVDINVVIRSFHLLIDSYMYKLQLWDHIGNYMIYLSDILIQHPTMINNDLFFEQLRQLILFEQEIQDTSIEHHRMIDKIRASVIIVINNAFRY